MSISALARKQFSMAGARGASPAPAIMTAPGAGARAPPAPGGLAAMARAAAAAEHVATGANLADMPSRDDLSLLRSLGSAPVPAGDVYWPDLSAGLTQAFHTVWDMLAGAESKADKRSRKAVEAAVAAMRNGEPVAGRPNGGRARARPPRGE